MSQKLSLVAALVLFGTSAAWPQNAPPSAFAGAHLPGDCGRTYGQRGESTSIGMGRRESIFAGRVLLPDAQGRGHRGVEGRPRRGRGEIRPCKARHPIRA